MHEKAEKRPQAEEAAQRLQTILERGEFVAGKYVSNQPLPAPTEKAHKASDKVCIPPTAGFLPNFWEAKGVSYQ